MRPRHDSLALLRAAGSSPGVFYMLSCVFHMSFQQHYVVVDVHGQNPLQHTPLESANHSFDDGVHIWHDGAEGHELVGKNGAEFLTG
jgi:hypothetical protein